MEFYHPSHIVREQVVLLLGSYPKSERRIHRLIDQITDSSWGVRVAVCQVLGKWRATEAHASLFERVVGDSEPAVRAAAEEALHGIMQEEEKETDGGSKLDGR